MSAAGRSHAPRQGVFRAARRHAAFVRIGFRQELSARGALLGRLAFFTLLLFVFSRLFELAARPGLLDGLPRAALLWYLAVTEWVLLSVPPLHLDIESDVRTGDVAARLPRPLSYPGARFAEAAGAAGARLVTIAVFGAPLTAIFAGGLPPAPAGLLLAIPFGVAAVVVMLALHAAIGLSAFWLQDVSPVYWIWQKAAFVLGGLLLPLDLYPGWLRALAHATPFPALLYGPARLAFTPPGGEALATGLAIVAWGLLSAALLRSMWTRARRVLDVNGG